MARCFLRGRSLTDRLVQTTPSCAAARLLAVSRQHILLLLLPILKNQTGCQPFGTPHPLRQANIT